MKAAAKMTDTSTTCLGMLFVLMHALNFCTINGAGPKSRILYAAIYILAGCVVLLDDTFEHRQIWGLLLFAVGIFWTLFAYFKNTSLSELAKNMFKQKQ